MKLGYFVPNFPSQTHIFFWREIESLRAQGVDVHLFSTVRPRKNITPHAWSQQAIAETTYVGVPTLRAMVAGLTKATKIMAMDSRISFKKEAMIFAPAAMQLKLAAQKHGLDHIHVHSCGRTAFIAMLCSFMGGPSYSLTLHSALKDYGDFQCMKWQNAKFCTVVSDHLLREAQEQIGDCFPVQVFKQAMGVEANYFSRTTTYSTYPNHGPVKIFSCGRLHKSKGHTDMIDAVALLVAKGINVVLTIAGEDKQGGTGFRKTIEKHITDKKMINHVRLLGAVDGDIVRKHLFDSHIFALASRVEAIGVAYMEAMCSGVPTIGTTVGGVPELIEDGINGLLVPPNDAMAMANAVEMILADPTFAQSLARRGTETVIAQYTSQNAAQSLVAAVQSSIQKDPYN